MKKLVNSALILAAIAPLATGCIFVSDDDDGSSGKATVNAIWHLKDDGADATCPPGGKITIIALRDGDPTPFRDSGIACDSGSATADPYDPGTYTFEVDVLDANDNLIARSETSDPLVLNAGDNDDANFDIDIANGYFDVSYNLQNADGSPTSCAALAPKTVSVLGTIAGTQDATDVVIDNCSEGEAPNVKTVGGYPVAGPTDYVLSFAIILDKDCTDNCAVGDAPDLNETFDYANEFIALNTVDIKLFQ